MAATTTDVLGSYWTLAGDADPLASDEDDARQWSQWDFEDRVEKAAEVGFTGMGFWHADLAHVLEHRTLEELKEILDANGIEAVELEFLNFWHCDESDERRRAEAETRSMLLAAAEVLDANHLKVGNIPGVKTELEQVEAAFETLCAEASDHDTKVGLELIPVDPNVTSLEEALSVVETPENGGIVLDTWHVAKMGIDYDAVRAIPESELVGVEINDGYWETDVPLDVETVNQRTLPGEGEFDVSGFVAAVRETGFDGYWGIEVLSEQLRHRPMNELYERAYDSAEAVL